MTPPRTLQPVADSQEELFEGFGTVLSVEIRYAGSELVGVHTAPVSVLQVRDVSELPPSGVVNVGGVVVDGALVGGDELTYSATDDLTDPDTTSTEQKVLLDTPTATTYPDRALVTLVPVAEYKVAVVLLDAAPDVAVECLVDHRLEDSLAEGPRPDGAGESVRVRQRRDELHLTVETVKGRRKKVDARYIAPGTLKLATAHDPDEDMSAVTFLGATIATPAGIVVLDPGSNTGAIFDMITAAAAGFDPRQSCRFATTGAETFTIVSGSVTQIAGTTVDGGSPGVSDRILVKNAPAASGPGVPESAHPANGIYRVTNATTNLTLTRVSDMNGTHDPQGDFVFVEAGSRPGRGFVVTVPASTGSFTYGTNNIAWTQFSGPGQSAGLLISDDGSVVLDVADYSNPDDVDTRLLAVEAAGGAGVDDDWFFNEMTGDITVVSRY